jgi:hypothetical protein
MYITEILVNVTRDKRDEVIEVSVSNMNPNSKRKFYKPPILAEFDSDNVNKAVTTQVDQVKTTSIQYVQIKNCDCEFCSPSKAKKIDISSTGSCITPGSLFINYEPTQDEEELHLPTTLVSTIMVDITKSDLLIHWRTKIDFGYATQLIGSTKDSLIKVKRNRFSADTTIRIVVVNSSVDYMNAGPLYLMVIDESGLDEHPTVVNKDNMSKMIKDIICHANPNNFYNIGPFAVQIESPHTTVACHSIEPDGQLKYNIEKVEEVNTNVQDTEGRDQSEGHQQ